MAGMKRDDDMLCSVCCARSRLLCGKGDLFDWGLLIGVGHSEVAERNCLWIPIEQSCGHCWVARARSGGCVTQHFLRSRLHWSLRKRLTVVGVIPAGLLAFVSTTVVVVPM